MHSRDDKVPSGQIKVTSGDDKVHSGEDKVHSGEKKVHSDEKNVHSDEKKVHSDEKKVHSDEKKVHSDEKKVHSGENKVHSDEKNVHSGAKKVHSDWKNKVQCSRYRNYHSLDDDRPRPSLANSTAVTLNRRKFSFAPRFYLPHDGDDLQQINTLKDEIHDLKQLLNIHHKQIKKMQHREIEIKECSKEQIYELQQKNCGLQKQVQDRERQEALLRRRLEESSEIIEINKKEKEKVHELLSKAIHLSETENMKHRQLLSEISQLNMDKHGLQQQAETMEGTIRAEPADEELQDRKELFRLQQTSANKEPCVKQLITENEKQKTINESLEKVAVEMGSRFDSIKSNYNREKAELEESRTRLREISEDNQCKDKQVFEFRTKLEYTEKKFQEAQRNDEKRIQDLETEKSKLESCHQTELSSYKQLITDLEKRVQELSKENLTLKELSKESKKRYSDEIESLKYRLQKTETELEEHKTRIQLGDNRSIIGLKLTITHLEQENHKLEAHKEQLEATNIEMKDQIRLLKNKADGENHALRKQICQLEIDLKRLEGYKERNQDMERDLTYLKSQLTDTQKALLQTKNNKEHTERTLEKRNQDDIERYEKEISSYRQNLSDLNSHIENLTKENKKLNDDNNSLQVQIDHQETELKEKETELSNLNTRYSEERSNTKHEIDDLKSKLVDTEAKMKKDKQERLDLENETQCRGKEIMQLQRTITSLEQQIEQLLQENKHIKKDIDQQMHIRENKPSDASESRDTKTRLSKCMGGDELTNNNQNIVYLSDINRPSKLAERYMELYDNQWTDAYELLEKSAGAEEQIIKILLETLIETKRFCDHHTEMEMDHIMKVITRKDKWQQSEVPVSVIYYIKNRRKSTAAETMKTKYKEYVDDLKKNQSSFVKHALRLDAYLQECFEVCWLMAIQDPPVVLAPVSKQGDTFKTDLYSAYTVTGKIVDYVVWPALLLHTNGPTLTKGVAQGMKER